MSASTTAVRAEKIVLVAISANVCRPAVLVIHAGVSAWIRPSRVTTERVGSRSSRHHWTSVRSPNVQHMAMPAPLSISASGWATTGTSTPNTGEVTVVPKSEAYRSSSGWAMRATQAGSSSGRVVSI